MNVIARLEFELAYYDPAVRRFNHYTARTPPVSVDGSSQLKQNAKLVKMFGVIFHQDDSWLIPSSVTNQNHYTLMGKIFFHLLYSPDIILLEDHFWPIRNPLNLKKKQFFERLQNSLLIVLFKKMCFWHVWTEVKK